MLPSRIGWSTVREANNGNREVIAGDQQTR
jgi:hypothetical protein